MTQKDAVYQAIEAILVGAGISFTSGVTDASIALTKDLRAQVTTLLVLNFNSNLIELSEEARTRMTDNTVLRAYVSGLISNWLRKDPRLNAGNAPIKVKSTVKRTSNDPQLKAMRLLLKAKTNPAEVADIQSFIDKRVQELSQ